MFYAALWIVAGVGALVLLVAAIRSRNDKLCKGYEIDIAGGGDHWFMDKNDVVQVLTGNGAYKLRGRAIKLFDLRRLEEKLERDVWIKDAELFFDNNNVLRVKIEEREPIARLFTTGGNSFYIDSTGAGLPLSDKLSARLPVFTGFPSEKPKPGGADSALIAQIKQVSAFLLKDPFWMAQIAQVDITPDRKFEMVPTIGNHLIDFGNGMDCDKKFGRLLTFYRQVLSKTGMNIYDRINVQYERQVIGVRRGAATSKFDSLQAAKKIEMLIVAAQAPPPAAQPDTTQQRDTEKPPINTQTVPKRTRPLVKKVQPVKSRSYETSANPVKEPTDKPKAVMPKRGAR